MCYAAAHTLVIYDCQERQQALLQGHCNAITCLATTDDRTVIASADQGPDSLIVLWDAGTGNPIRTLPRPHAAGVQAMDLTADGRQLVTVSAPCEGVQELARWDLSSPAKVKAVLVCGFLQLRQSWQLPLLLAEVCRPCT